MPNTFKCMKPIHMTASSAPYFVDTINLSYANTISNKRINFGLD